MKNIVLNQIAGNSLLLIPLLALLTGCASTPTDPMKATLLPPEKWKFKTPEAVLKAGDVRAR